MFYELKIQKGLVINLYLKYLKKISLEFFIQSMKDIITDTKQFLGG